MFNELLNRPRFRTVARLGWLALAGGMTGGDGLAAGATAETGLPPAATNAVEFARDIEPIFAQSCVRCHGSERPKSRFGLDSRAAALRGGEHGVAIVPGRSAESPLLRYVARLVPDLEMPPTGKGEPLTREQVGLLRAWVEQGAPWTAATNAPAFRFSAVPTIGAMSVSGNRRAFRQQERMREGVTGGVQEFSLEQKLRDETRLRLEGRALTGQEDYRAKLTLEKSELGFVRGGYEQRRRYYDDVGDYYSAIQPSSFALGRDLHVDFSRAWAEVGLTIPDLPKLTLGYEQQRTRGAKFTVLWGPVGALPPGIPGTDVASIFPAFEELQERVHVLKLDLAHDVRGFQLEDSLRVEWQDLRRTRETATQHTFGATPDLLVRAAERHRERQVANVFRVERRVRDWLLVSAGHLYTHSGADADFRQETLTGARAPTFGNHWFGGPVVLKRDTHSIGGSALWGPWDGLSLSSALQAEWTRQEGFAPVDYSAGDPSVPFFFSDPATLSASFDRTTTDENFGLHYTRIPRTVLFADARFRQEDQRRWEQQFGGPEPFAQNRDSTRDVQEYRVGANVAPFERITVSGHLKRRVKESRFDGPTGAPPPGHAYPGFIRAQDIDTDEGELRVSWRPSAWLRTSVSYRVLASDYRTTTAVAADQIGTPAAASTGGGIFAGNYDAHFYGLNVFVAPVRRLTLAADVSYGDTRLATAQNGAAFAPPTRGDSYSLGGSATFALNPATDLSASLTWAGANYRQNNVAAELPAGTDYERIAVQSGLSRRLTAHAVAGLRYQFVRYREPTAGGARDYTGHGVFATLSVTLP